jgi:GAF domain-containing protein
MMTWQYSPFTLPLLIGAAVSAVMTLFVWRRRQFDGARFVGLFTLSVVVWFIAYTFEFLSPDLAAKSLWLKVKFTSAIIPSISWLIFSLYYNERKKWLALPIQFLLGLVHIITIVMVWTNELHHLLWSDINLIRSTWYSFLSISYGVWFWVFFAISNLYYAISAILFIAPYKSSIPAPHGQRFTLSLAAILPLINNLLFVSQIEIIQNLDLTPFVLISTGIFVVWFLYRNDFPAPNLTPSDLVIANMKDGVITLDSQFSLVSINPAANKIINPQISITNNHKLVDIFPTQPDLEETIRMDINADIEFPLCDGEEIAHYRLRASELNDSQGDPSGIMLILSDISNKKSNEEELRQKLEIINRRSSQLEASARVAMEASTIRELEHLLSRTTQLIAEHFPYYHTGIFLLDNRRKYAVLQATNSPGGQRMLAKGHKLSIEGTSIVGFVAETGTSRIALDTGADTVYFDNPDLPETRSEIALPLIIREKVIGVLDVQSTEPNAFSPSDIETLQMLADQIALTIDNSRLFESNQQVIDELKSTYGEQAHQGWQKQIGDSPKAYYYDQIRVVPTQQYPELTENADTHQLAIPVSLRGQKIGSIILRREENENPWTSDDKDLATDAAAQVAVALENARLLNEARRLADNEKTISEISTAFSRSINVENILKTAIRELGQLPSIAEVSVHLGPPEKSS